MERGGGEKRKGREREGKRERDVKAAMVKGDQGEPKTRGDKLILLSVCPHLS